MEQICRELHAGKHVRVESVDHIDPMSSVGGPRKPRPVDIQIHLEVPCRAAWSWARYNVVVVNPEWWPATAWDWTTAPKERGGADLLIFKSEHARRLFPELEGKRSRVLKWRAGPEIQTALCSLAKSPPVREFLYLIGASANKLAAAHVVCGAWASRGAGWPPLRVVGTEKVIAELKAAAFALPAPPANLVFQTSYPDDSSRIAAQAGYAYHVVASVAEGFGYTFAEAASVGALPLWTDIPVYKELWEGIVGNVGVILRSGESPTESKYRDAIIPAAAWTAADVARGVESLLSLSAEDEARLRGALRHAATTRVKEFRHEWRNILGAVEHRLHSVPTLKIPPKPLAAADLPHVAVITIT
ncbi:MAG: hypothetical protein EBR07_12445, partial [Planctomycetes bacterium]|nr:hypothetical protein [Planctomycetota bacterium]